MGAEFWEHLIRHEPDPEAALHRLQAEVFESSQIDLDEIVRDRIDALAEAIWDCDPENDSAQIETCRIILEDLRRLAAEGPPPTTNGRVRWLQRVSEIGTDGGAPGVLGIEGLASQPEYYLAYCPLDWQAEEICGTARPTATQASEGVRRLDYLQPGMAICLPVYDGDRPVSWYFAGYSFD